MEWNLFLFNNLKKYLRETEVNVVVKISQKQFPLLNDDFFSFEEHLTLLRITL